MLRTLRYEVCAPAIRYPATKENQMTPQDLRAEIARRQISLYQLAATVRLHPGRLGQMLRERVPMPTEIAERVSEALTSGDAIAR
jgi:hypothetical protein